PIYQAWEFLTRRIKKEDRIETPEAPKSDPESVDETQDSLFTAIGKLGGLNKQEVIETWGIDPKDKPQSGVFGKPLWRVEGGLSIDGMAEALSQYGYLVLDENGKWDVRDLEEAFRSELDGAPFYSTAHAYSDSPTRPGDQVVNPGALSAGRFDAGALRELLGGPLDSLTRAITRQASTFKEAREAASAFVGSRDKPGKPLTNRETGMTAVISSGNLGKMLSQKAVGKSVSPAIHALAVANADTLFEIARLGETHADRDNNPNIKAIHRFYAPMATGTNVFSVKLTVKEFQSGNANLYTLEAVEIENATASIEPENPGGVGDQENLRRPPGSGAMESIARWMESVKEDVSRGAYLAETLKSRGMVSENGLHPDLVAELFGFDSGDALVRQLADATPPKEAIDAMTDQIMVSRHAELSSPEAVQEAADAAVHNKALARFAARELSALLAMSGEKAFPVELAAIYARNTLGKIPVRRLNPARYANAAMKAANAAEAALKKGDVKTAAREKRHQLLLLESARQAVEIQEKLKKAKDYFKRVATPNKIPADHREQIVNLLSKFGLAKARSDVKSFGAWAKSLMNGGLFPPNTEALLTPEALNAYVAELEATDGEGNPLYPDDTDRAELLARYTGNLPDRAFNDVTVETALQLRNVVAQIEAIGKREKSLLLDQRKRDFAAVVEAIQSNLIAVAGRRGLKPRQHRSGITPTDKAREGLARFFAGQTKAATLVNLIDGREGGPLWEALIRTANEASNAETIESDQVRAILSEILDRMRASGKFMGSVFVEELGRSLTRSELLAVAMNLGNESNLQRLLDGEGWTLQQVKAAIAKHLTASDLLAVQSLWDLYESFRPRVGEMERELSGVEPEWIKARPISLKTRDGQTITLRGGYAPVIFDPRASEKSREQHEAKDAKSLLSAARVASSVEKSFTKSRVERVRGRPLKLDMNAFVNAFQDTIHYLHWQKWILDANRLLRALTPTISQYYSPEVSDELRAFSRDNAVGRKIVRDAGADFAVLLTRNLSFASMAYSFTTAIKQPLGFANSIAVLSP
ncbi:MAG: hypothetical protein LBJ76_03470, partial [Candidatus Accumulibacter sp.]|nr:hypothetical protein [Accumulibacter sp.]